MSSLPSMVASQIAATLILLQIVSALISFQTKTAGLALISSAATLAFVTGYFCAPFVTPNATPSGLITTGVIIGTLVGSTFLFLSWQALKQNS